MNDVPGVRRCESTDNLLGVTCRRARVDCSSIQVRAEVFAFEQLRDDVARAFVMADIVNGEDVRMVQGGRGERFLFKAAKPVFIGRKRGRQELDGDVAIQPRVARAIDFSHPAGAQ